MFDDIDFLYKNEHNVAGRYIQTAQVLSVNIGYVIIVFGYYFFYKNAHPNTDQKIHITNIYQNGKTKSLFTSVTTQTSSNNYIFFT